MRAFSVALGLILICAQLTSLAAGKRAILVVYDSSQTGVRARYLELARRLKDLRDSGEYSEEPGLDPKIKVYDLARPEHRRSAQLLGLGTPLPALALVALDGAGIPTRVLWRSRSQQVEASLNELDGQMQGTFSAGPAAKVRQEARRAYRDRNYPAALKALDQAIKITPKDASAYRARAYCRVQSGDLDGALADARKALSLKPKWVSGLRTMAYVQLRRRDFPMAYQAADEALQQQPNSIDSLLLRAEARAGLNDGQRAIDDLNRALALDPENAQVYAMLGVIRLRNLDDPAGAITAISQALALEATPDYYVLRALSRTQTRDLEGAITDLNLALETDPGLVTAYLCRAQAEDLLERHAEAVADYTRYLEAHPESAPTLERRGLARLALKDGQGALADLNLAVQLDPLQPHFLRSRAQVYDFLGKAEEAAADRRHADLLAP